MKNKQTEKLNETLELDEEILRSVAFMRQEKCEYDKSELQSLLEGSEPGSEDTRNFETMLDRTLQRRRLLDILIDNINMIDFRNGK